MEGHRAKIFSVCFWLLFSVHVALVVARNIRQTQNSDDGVQHSISNGIRTTETARGDHIDKPFRGDLLMKAMKRSLHATDVLENRKLEGRNEKIGIDAENIGSFEVAESHIFRPLFRPRVRKSPSLE